MSSLTLVLPANCTDTTLEMDHQDDVLDGAGAGIRWIYDFASQYSFPTQAAPADGALVKNINESGNDGAVSLVAGQTLNYAGGALDFSALTKRNSYLRGPADFAAGVWGGGTGLQYFSILMYLTLPAAADFTTDTSNGGLFPMMQFAGDTGSYQTLADLLLLNQNATTQRLQFRRQTAIAAGDTLTLQPVAADYGSKVQLLFCRQASGQTARLKSQNGAVLATAAVGAANSQNFSALTPKIGPVGAYATNSGAGGALSAGQANAVKWRHHIGIFENLALSGRDPIAVADADYARRLAQGFFA